MTNLHHLTLGSPPGASGSREPFWGMGRGGGGTRWYRKKYFRRSFFRGAHILLVLPRLMSHPMCLQSFPDWIASSQEERVSWLAVYSCTKQLCKQSPSMHEGVWLWNNSCCVPGRNLVIFWATLRQAGMRKRVSEADKVVWFAIRTRDRKGMEGSAGMGSLEWILNKFLLLCLLSMFWPHH